jgi:hypothetical protein
MVLTRSIHSAASTALSLNDCVLELPPRVVILRLSDAGRETFLGKVSCIKYASDAQKVEASKQQKQKRRRK